jgi:hypothetical protein
MQSDADDKEDSSDPLKVEIGAVAKAEAAAKYERKTQVSITVPEDVTRAKAQAFLHAISPFTHSLGLIGDWIADARERLKTHRLQALTAIAEKARKEIEGRAEEPGEIPLKALLPMLDKASLEEADDETLTTAWGALIASASLDYDPEVIAFSRILSELSPRECLILQRIFGQRWDWVLGKHAPAAMKRFFESEVEIKPMIREAVLKGDHSLFGKLQRYVDPSMPMEFTLALTRGVTQRVNWVDKVLKEPFYAENELGYRLLEAQGLIGGHGHSYNWRDGEIPVAVDWVTLTDLGARFVARVIPRSTKQEAETPGE